MSLSGQNKLANFGLFSPGMFLFCFYLWPYILYVKLFSRESADAFNITAHVFYSLFLRICPLFGQTLITCVKCSRASFSHSSCSEKMHWGRGCSSAVWFLGVSLINATTQKNKNLNLTFFSLPRNRKLPKYGKKNKSHRVS